ncbi:Protein TIC 22, chloroplastic [Glycine soja]|uniref:Protein TIC 22, chloroplastic n=1 Tax=Glycine soja TaxID=3848 RepID=A0A0B2PF70_GLYSO|nr:Protein TIC 22, chloroplastic [Glycine soja]
MVVRLVMGEGDCCCCCWGVVGSIEVHWVGDYVYFQNRMEMEMVVCEVVNGRCEWWSVRNVAGNDVSRMGRMVFCGGHVGLEDLKRAIKDNSSLAQAHHNLLFPKHALAHAATATLGSQHVAKSLVGTSIFTVNNSNNEFVLISDPDGAKSIGLLCFRQEDAEAFLAQVRSRSRELRSKAKVVPITLDYMLKVEGIAFRFLLDPVQIRNALELLAVKKRNKHYCPVYFSKEDIEQELSKVSRASRAPGVSQHITV